MKRHLLSGIAVAAGLTGLSSASEERKPNVIVILTDDWGYGDLGVFGNLADVKTPNLDRLAKDGVLFTDGYVTAPQCAPSRAGLMTGRYQQRYGFDTIPDCPLPLEEKTLADRLKIAGYVTGMVGKWHLDPNHLSLKWARKYKPEAIKGNTVQLTHKDILTYAPQERGFDWFYCGEMSPYWCNYDLQGNALSSSGETVKSSEFRVDVQTEAGLAFIKKNSETPFFLYLSYFSPHVPLEATETYLKRFSGDMPERRRTARAMMAAVDDGVGQIMDLLDQKGLKGNTLIVFTSDNGAPLGAQTPRVMDDVLPVGKAGPIWDGSRNDPLRGEKGMLAEGGMRVPFIMSWPDCLPQGTVYKKPVISLDIAATANAIAGLPHDPAFDGVNLLPYLTGESTAAPHDDLYWKFWNQAAIRSGDWKFIRSGQNIEMLFNMQTDKEETRDVISQYPEIAQELKKKLSNWADQMAPSGLPSGGLNDQEEKWYRYYFTNLKDKSEVAVIPSVITPVPVGPLPTIYAAMDSDGDNILSETEFVEGRAILEKPILMKKENLTEAQYQTKLKAYKNNYRANFKKRDVSGDNLLDAGELK